MLASLAATVDDTTAVFDDFDYARALEAVRSAASDAGRDPMPIIPAINRAVVTGRNRDDVDETLNSVVIKTTALAAPADTWARHGVPHPLGTDFSGMQDLVPQTIDEQTMLTYAAKVPASLMKELIFNGTPDEVIDQMAEWRDHGLRYALILNASPLNPRLRKTLVANTPFLKILRGLRKL